MVDQKWPSFRFLHKKSAIFDSDRIKVGGTLGCTESGSAKLNANLNLPSGFGLSYFIVFNSISREDTGSIIAARVAKSAVGSMFRHDL